MSRTFRRKQGHGWSYGDYSLRDALTDRDYIRYEYGEWWRYCWFNVIIDPKSKEGKKRIAKFHSDATTVTQNGPAWFITMQQRCYRRNAKRELHKFFQDEEHEVIIADKPKLEYWW